MAHYRVVRNHVAGLAVDIETKLAEVEKLASEGNIMAVQRSCNRARRQYTADASKIEGEFDALEDKVRCIQAGVCIAKPFTQITNTMLCEGKICTQNNLGMNM